VFHTPYILYNHRYPRSNKTIEPNIRSLGFSEIPGIFLRLCQSNVWLIAEVKQNGQLTIELQADSDSMLVKGLVFVLLTIYSGRTSQDILAIDVKNYFERLGFDRYLSSARRNGLFGMVNRIRSIAEQSA